MLEWQTFWLNLNVIILKKMRQRNLECIRRKKPSRASLCPVTPSRRVGAGSQEMEAVFIPWLLPKLIKSIHVETIWVWPQIRVAVDSLSVNSNDQASGKRWPKREFHWLFKVALEGDWKAKSA